MNIQKEGKFFELEERTFQFASLCKVNIHGSKYSIANHEYGKQLSRSSGSVAANYIEANEAGTKNEFFYRIGLCKKEAKESILWLRLTEIDVEN